MKKRLTLAIFLIAALSTIISSVVGVVTFRDREVDAARQNLEELLSLMDAQNWDTYPATLLEQFAKAAAELDAAIAGLEG